MVSQRSKALLLLKAQVKNATELFLETQPEAFNWLKQQNLTIGSIRTNLKNPVGQKIAGEINRLHYSGAVNISKDEQKSIIEKIIAITQLPAGQLSSNDALYLEQQISDLIGIEVVSKLKNHTLPYNYGIISSGKHFKRYASDKLELHQGVHEAGINNSRSDFGWIKSEISKEEKSDYIEQEMYSINVPLQTLDAWQANRSELKKWYKGKKVIAINPYNNKAVLASITGTGPSVSSRRQFQGSPELIRHLEAWSLEAQGRVMVLFVSNENSQVPLGPVAFSELGVKI